MLSTIFREYDIRGRVGTEFDLNHVYELAQAIAYYFLHKRPTVKTIVVGMDGRTHSPLIKDELCRGLTDSGLDVVFVGVCTSPALYFALYTLPVDAGLMITASHNPPDYNGLKICLGKESVWGVAVKEIWHLFNERKKIMPTSQGTITMYPIIDDYVSWLAHHFKHLENMNLSVVIDCGNGAAGTVLPSLLKAMNWAKVHLLYPEVDGTYPNHEADPVKEKNMRDVKHILHTTNIQVGIGLDGDADRMVPMTKSGYLVPGDRMLALFSKYLLRAHPNAAIVMDIKSSAVLLELLEQWQARACLSPSGHAIIKDQIRKHGALLGGELSCHFFFNDRYFGYDDGIYAMMRLFEILTDAAQDLDALLQEFPQKVSSPEILIQCPEEKKRVIVQEVTQFFAARSGVNLITIDGVRAHMEYGWGIVRASNTQPMLSLRFESDSLEGLRTVKSDFIQALTPYFDSSLLKEQVGL